MFNVGDKIVYPLYGAGVIEAVEDRPSNGTLAFYYVMDIPVGNLKITVSAAKSDALGLRPINTRDAVINAINKSEPLKMSSNWTQRYKDNMNILKSGDLFQIIGVFKTLILRERVRSLSSAEKKLLGTTKQIILTEIILALDTDKRSAEEILTSSMPVSA